MRSISLIALTLALAPLGASCGPKEGRTLGGVDVGTRVEAPGAAVARYSTAATGDPVIGEATAEAIKHQIGTAFPGHEIKEIEVVQTFVGGESVHSKI